VWPLLGKKKNASRQTAPRSRAAAVAHELSDGAPERQRQLLSAVIHQITLRADSMGIEIKRSGLDSLLAEAGAHKHSEGQLSLVIPMQIQRRASS